MVLQPDATGSGQILQRGAKFVSGTIRIFAGCRPFIQIGVNHLFAV